MTRNGYPEEVYMTFSYSPIRDDSGAVAGLFCACTEETRQVLGRRRLRLLRSLAERTAQAKSVEEACQLGATTLADNPQDLPFALVYQLDETGRNATLAGLTGLAGDTQASPATINLHQTSAPWPLAQGSQTGQPIEVTTLPGPFPPITGAVVAIAPGRAFVLPIPRPGLEGWLAGFLVVGIRVCGQS